MRISEAINTTDSRTAGTQCAFSLVRTECRDCCAHPSVIDGNCPNCISGLLPAVHSHLRMLAAVQYHRYVERRRRPLRCPDLISNESNAPACLGTQKHRQRQQHGSPYLPTLKATLTNVETRWPPPLFRPRCPSAEPLNPLFYCQKPKCDFNFKCFVPTMGLRS